ncbi:unnamed protein product [Clavelina lepadiformis]|uniref:Uncharacterized protein n=1 Tax=Clavelina lepadiformis TaxID=159417 RepID=A0ABP0F3J6_CLALP
MSRRYAANRQQRSSEVPQRCLKISSVGTNQAKCVSPKLFGEVMKLPKGLLAAVDLIANKSASHIATGFR